LQIHEQWSKKDVTCLASDWSDMSGERGEIAELEETATPIARSTG